MSSISKKSGDKGTFENIFEYKLDSKLDKLYDTYSKNPFVPSNDILNINEKIDELENEIRKLKEKRQELFKKEFHEDPTTITSLYAQLRFRPELTLPFVEIEDGKIAKFELNNVRFDVRAHADNGYTSLYKLTCKIPLENKKLSITSGINGWENRSFLEFEYIQTDYEPHKLELH